MLGCFLFAGTVIQNFIGLKKNEPIIVETFYKVYPYQNKKWKETARKKFQKTLFECFTQNLKKNWENVKRVLEYRSTKASEYPVFDQAIRIKLPSLLMHQALKQENYHHVI